MKSTFAILIVLAPLALTGCGKSEKEVAAERQAWMDHCRAAEFTQSQCALLSQINAAAQKASDDADGAASMAVIAQVRASSK